MLQLRGWRSCYDACSLLLAAGSLGCYIVRVEGQVMLMHKVSSSFTLVLSEAAELSCVENLLPVRLAPSVLSRF